MPPPEKFLVQVYRVSWVLAMAMFDMWQQLEKDGGGSTRQSWMERSVAYVPPAATSQACLKSVLELVVAHAPRFALQQSFDQYLQCKLSSPPAPTGRSGACTTQLSANVAATSTVSVPPSSKLVDRLVVHSLPPPPRRRRFWRHAATSAGSWPSGRLAASPPMTSSVETIIISESVSEQGARSLGC